MRRLVILAVTTLAVALILPLAASAVVVPQKRVGQVRIGASQANLSKVLRQPDRIIRATGFRTGLPMDIWEYRGLEIEFEGGNVVTAVTTTRKFERTRRGAGMGTPKWLLRTHHPKVRCGKGKDTFCFLGKPRRAGAKSTMFTLSGGRVIEIAIRRNLVG